jgi:hypothetical protein
LVCHLRGNKILSIALFVLSTALYVLSIALFALSIALFALSIALFVLFYLSCIRWLNIITSTLATPWGIFLLFAWYPSAILAY